jgi:hypothetical protein
VVEEVVLVEVVVPLEHTQTAILQRWILEPEELYIVSRISLYLAIRMRN